MKKTTNRRSRALKTVNTAQLARVAGGRNAQQYAASIQMLELQAMFAPGTPWNEFFGSAAEA